ncbi:PAS domain S-box protein [Ancylobacter radicis]|uniref:histidine kinase n=1 Tax=Ancylobacter radicis TaxID=2836179 RepID=A0ABS5R8Q9_9HYPH|nr:PAS domain S-box protein [Ancylobacter radicis]MBS9478059.1 PAS domain S-box protein [Ancylobacter radicis]
MPVSDALGGSTGGEKAKAVYLAVAAAALGAVFVADLWLPVHSAIAALYIVVVLIVAGGGLHRLVLPAGAICLLLTVIAYFVSPVTATNPNATPDLIVSTLVIACVTALALRLSVQNAPLFEQARILELTHDTVIVCNTADRIVYWNEGAERLYGWSRDEALGANCHDLLHSEYPKAEAENALSGTGNWVGELRRQRRDGTPVVLASRWLVRQDRRGRRIGVIETSSDLTAEWQAHEARRVSEERYEAIFHESPVSIWESDWTRVLAHLKATGVTPQSLRASNDQIAVARHLGSTHIANRATAVLFGTETPHAMVGKTFVAHYMPSTEAALAEIFATFLEGGHMREVETQFRTAQGKVIDVLWRATLLQGKSEWSRVLITAIDVTDRNNARLKLEQASADLAHAARISTLGQLSASIAHEVSQPLAAIKTYAESARRWLAAPIPDMSEVELCLDGVITATARASETLAHVRSLARKGTPQLEAFDLAGLIAESVRMVQREANAHETRIRELIEPGLPAAFANRVQIQQVIVNLVLNAIQAMDKVEGRPREVVVCLSSAPDRMMNVEVRDNGTGIALDNPNEIFQPFRTTKANGMGMGLAICRSIVEAHGGTIRAENNSGVGATVSFIVPMEINAPAKKQHHPVRDAGRAHDPMASADRAAGASSPDWQTTQADPSMPTKH